MAIPDSRALHSQTLRPAGAGRRSRAGPRSVDDLPAAVGLPAGGAVGRFGLAVDHHGGLVLAAIGFVGRLVGPRRRRIAAVAGVRILPGAGLAVRVLLERGIRALRRLQPVGVVHRAADLAADPGAEHGAAGGGDELAGPAADLRAEQAAGDAADDRAARLLRAAALATGYQRDNPEHRQDSYRAHDELPHWM